MDLLLLLVQCLLVILLVVVPLFSGYDKWQKWSPTRRAVAVALGAGIAIVAFTQYRKLIFLHKADLPQAFGGFEGGRHAAWYVRPVKVFPVEYVVSVTAGSLLLTLAFQAAKRRRWGQCLGFGVLFCVLMAVGLTVKLQLWR